MSSFELTEYTRENPSDALCQSRRLKARLPAA